MLGSAPEPREEALRRWPWEEETVTRPEHRPTGAGGAWSLTFATLAVLVGGYAWLGSVFGDLTGALVGGSAGLLLTGLLYLLVEAAVSGPRAAHRRGRGMTELRLPLRRRG